jgi:membrane protease YdiL (CAAX protease family)
MRKILLHPAGVICTATILVIFGGLRFFAFEYDGAWLASPFSTVFTVAKALIFLLVVPLFLLRLLKEDASGFGFRFPESGHAREMTIALLVVLLAALGASFVPALREFYADPGATLPVFIASAGALSLLYYAAEEFLFRGFLFWGLFRRIGMHSFWVTNLLFALFHAGKPVAEIPIAFFLGLLFSYVAWRTKSFLPAAVLHFTLAIILNILVAFVWSAPSPSASFHF